MLHPPSLRWIHSSPSLLIVISLLITGCGGGGGGDAWEPITQAVMAKVVQQPVVESLSLVGNLEANHQADLVSELDAHVTDILFVEGQRVTNAQPLFILDNSGPAALLAAAETEAALRQADLERGKSLHENRTISKQEFDRIEAAAQTAQANLLVAQVNSDDSIIRAPFDGRIANHDISVGTFVRRGQTLSSVVATDTLKVSFNVPERYISELAVDQVINLSSSASTNLYPGTVYFVSPSVDEMTRTVLVKATVPNEQGELRPGMFGRLELTLRIRDNALTIPESAIKYGNNAAMVVVGQPNATNSMFLMAEFRPVVVGTRMKDQVEVLSGLQVGEFVVVEGHQKMGPGGKIIISPKSEKYGVTPPAPPASSTPETTKAE